jgi:hypothetical protein
MQPEELRKVIREEVRDAIRERFGELAPKPAPPKKPLDLWPLVLGLAALAVVVTLYRH